MQISNSFYGTENNNQSCKYGNYANSLYHTNQLINSNSIEIQNNYWEQLESTFYDDNITHNCNPISSSTQYNVIPQNIMDYPYYYYNEGIESNTVVRSDRDFRTFKIEQCFVNEYRLKELIREYRTIATIEKKNREIYLKINFGEFIKWRGMRVKKFNKICGKIFVLQFNSKLCEMKKERLKSQKRIWKKNNKHRLGRMH